jgi:cellulose 1,4-beta-cellobiosidase
MLPYKLFAQVELCQGASTTLMNGEYNVMNNVWGASTPQCLEVYMDSTYFKVTLSGHNNGNSVAAYPSIFKGCHWGWCTSKNNPMPVKVREIESAPTSWKVNTQNVSGTWNAAYDIWFSELSAGSDYSAEVMIWLDYHGGATPAGSKVATVEIGGIKWDLYFAAWSSWNYIAYKAITPIDSMNTDLRAFIDDAVKRGYIYTPWYLHAIEAGFEIFSGGQGLIANYFLANVTKTTTPKNFAPLLFRLQSPADKDKVDSLTVTFKWQQSTDPDLETIEYNLHISGTGADTVIAGIPENSYTFKGSTFFQSNTTYTWYVEATDKIDTTVCTVNRTFTTPASVGVKIDNKVPDKFVLFQNYPNPFNPSTIISYQLPVSSFIKLRVFDILGKEVAALVNEEQTAGVYNYTFSINNYKLLSGIYYYQLETSTQSLRKKCIYLK